ncbi:efflux RND transporter periplasmic adaptor subunit [Legionella cherrii]|uniref:p-hydroxybenzoic acid efflux pump subunit AaeA n=1 Tax=Legionella cherrii TaxID=28084 RepID=A0A0W0S920_9GAMM|nr:biotin/lipoyl-binding protein [Legionella cherrii]KTC79533.1 p-hydroxybenzoic acid efflux pump subunit AaeA [Legionella cherrii]VEB37458.1 p-hydroxybenzoic acid efflux subunit AaeA [Legionella cherrii]
MSIRTLFIIACLGILAGIASVIIYNEKIKPENPITVSYNPYEKGIYATGIVESHQPTGQNVNIYPQVSGEITAVFAQEGEYLKKGDPILTLDDSIQKELVAKDAAQIRYQEASLVNLQQQLEKNRKSFLLDPKSVSKNALDNAINAVKIQMENVHVAQKQYDADKALLDKYTLRSPIDGIILRVGVALGDYGSPLGRFDTYTQAMLPVVEMGVTKPFMEVRCFVDEILVPTLPSSSHLEATMFVRGVSNRGIPLEFIKIQPYLIPNIQLSNERTERVDVRVLPVLFKFTKPEDINIFPGQLVDIYIKGKK